MDERLTAHQDLWDEAPCGLIVASGEGTILHVNATLCGWLGYDADALVGVRRFSQLMPMGARVFLQTHWTPLLQIQGSVSEVQLDLLHRDGRRIPMMLSAIRRQRDGAINDDIAVLVATDRKAYERELLSARARAEAAAQALELAQAELREANDALSKEHQRKDEFLATLAHELRNPLSPMANALETARLKGADPQHWAWAVDVMGRQLGQMTRLVDDLLNVSRISKGKIALRLETIDLARTLRFAADGALPLIHAAGQSLAVDVDTAPLWTRGDHARLTQIVTNLLNNASKYSPAGARLHIAVRAEGRQAVIDVRDNGIGIPAQELEHIFTMFSQLTPALERAQGGLGIGLALVKGLVQLHGGSVSAHSEGLGKGSCFTVRLPLCASPSTQPSKPPSLPAAAPAAIRADGEPPGIVVVDDNVDAADTLAMALELMGYQVAVAYSAQAALELIEQSQPRAAVLDIGLPDVNGYELARRIRSAPWGARIALVAATGWGQDADKQQASEAGFDLHFTKPMDLVKLDNGLQALLGAV